MKSFDLETIDDFGLDPLTFRVYYAIACRSVQRDCKSVAASYTELAEVTSLSRPTVIKAVNLLLDLQLLRRQFDHLGISHYSLLPIPSERLKPTARQIAQGETAKRRKQFESAKGRLIKKLLDAGTPYQCAHKGCRIVKELTVDHVTPLSKGGSNDPSNLQFMCKSHNSSKGAKI